MFGFQPFPVLPWETQPMEQKQLLSLAGLWGWVTHVQPQSVTGLPALAQLPLWVGTASPGSQPSQRNLHQSLQNQLKSTIPKWDRPGTGSCSCFPSPSRQPQITCCFSLSPSIQGLCSEPANDFGDSFKDPLVCLSACSCSLVECLMEFIHIL